MSMLTKEETLDTRLITGKLKRKKHGSRSVAPLLAPSSLLASWPLAKEQLPASFGEKFRPPHAKGVAMTSIPPKRRTSRYRSIVVFGKRLVGCSAALMVFACAASPAPPSSTAVPQAVRALVAATDTLLAYKPADLYGDGSQAAVIVVRHPASEKSDYDSNPCDLVVLHRVNGKLIEADHSAKAVDCTYNDIARRAPAMSLNDDLDVAPGSITFVNQQRYGWSSFEFAWSKDKGTWYLRRATASSVDSENNGTQTTLSYPKHLGWTPMAAIDPDAIAEALQKQGKTNQ